MSRPQSEIWLGFESEFKFEFVFDYYFVGSYPKGLIYMSMIVCFCFVILCMDVLFLYCMHNTSFVVYVNMFIEKSKFCDIFKFTKNRLL